MKSPRPTFSENGWVFQSLYAADIDAMALCNQLVTIQRIRITQAGVLIEIDGPLPVIEGEVKTQDEYALVRFGSCSVAWKLPNGDQRE